MQLDAGRKAPDGFQLHYSLLSASPLVYAGGILSRL